MHGGLLHEEAQLALDVLRSAASCIILAHGIRHVLVLLRPFSLLGANQYFLAVNITAACRLSCIVCMPRQQACSAFLKLLFL